MTLKHNMRNSSQRNIECSNKHEVNERIYDKVKKKKKMSLSEISAYNIIRRFYLFIFWYI